MKTFGYLLMAVTARMTCSCRDKEPLPDPVSKQGLLFI